MGLKTNKATNTSRLNCQYVGSFPVSDGERKLSSSEQNKFVIEKLKSCKKKLIDGMAVFLEVSPDGVRVLADDEKTVKMAHSLRRISYATAEASNKLFAYVSHQPGTDMEIVCHTFLTKKKDHAEGLSAVLGKLFKQTFAYTLKRRDRLDEVAQKRGANRRWAKQQVAEGHNVANARRGPRITNQQSTKTNEPRGQNVAVPQQGSARSAMANEPRSPTREGPSFPVRSNPKNGLTGSLQNQSRPDMTGGSSEGQTAPSVMTSEPGFATRERPTSPTRTSPTNGVPGSLQNQPRPASTVGPSEGQTSASAMANEPSFPNVERSSSTRTNPTNGAVPGSLQNQSGPARTVDPSEVWTPTRESGPSSPTRSMSENEAPPPLPKRKMSQDTNIGVGSALIPRRPPKTSEPSSPTRESSSSSTNPTNGVLCSLQNQSRAARTPVGPGGQTHGTSVMASERSSPTRESPSSPIQRNPANDALPRLPVNRHASDTSIGLPSLENQPRAVDPMVPGSEVVNHLHRKMSAPPDLFQPSRSHPSNDGRPLKRASISSCTEEVAPTWLTTNAPSRSLQMAASALLAEAGDVPPPLPRRQWETIEQRDTTIPPLQEEVSSVEENGGVWGNEMVGSLEGEEWYIPGVSREMVTEMLETSDIGTFFVRDSQSQPGHYALTMKVVKGSNNPSGFGNYLIVPVTDGFTLQGFDKVFPDVFTLIRHHASHEDGLPCRLVLAGSNPLFQDANGYLVEYMDEENETYACLFNCTSMFSELEMKEDPWQ